MRHITIHTTDKEYHHFIELVKNLPYVKKIETDDFFENDLSIQNIRAGLLEVSLFNQGILKTTPAKDFLDEL